MFNKVFGKRKGIKNKPPTAVQRHANQESHDDMTVEETRKRIKNVQKRGKRRSDVNSIRNNYNPMKQNSNDDNKNNDNNNNNNNNHNGINDDNKNNSINSDMNGHNKHPRNQQRKKNMNAMMGAAATQDRLQQLMKMRGPGKDSKDARSRSMNVRNDVNYPKRRKDNVHKEDIRRHSMFPDEKSERDKQKLKDRRTGQQLDTNKKNKGQFNKVQYRVKNEVFILYDYYQPVRIIGSGAYAVVCEALNTITGKKCAVKKNKGVFDHITDARRILREIKLMMHFSHQDIIELIDVIPPDHSEIDTFNDVYLVMPKIETNLAKVIRSKQKLTDKHFQFFMYQLLRGLKYMHSAGVIHRDLKPENILINGADCNVKITDFGLARGVCKDEVDKPTEYVVTRWYRSPEVMCSAGFYDEKVDIWSIGCIFAELILRRPIFPGQNYLDQLKIIFDIMGTPRDLTWIKTPEAKRWVQKLKPHKGKALNEVFAKATKIGLDILSKMLLLDPNKRPTAIECLEHMYFKDLHNENDEVTCPKFDLSFEFEKSIKTKFGVRHMMYDALLSFETKRNMKKHKRYSKNKKHAHQHQQPPQQPQQQQQQQQQ